VVSAAKQRRSSSISLESARRSSTAHTSTTPLNTSVLSHDSSSSSRSSVSLPTSPLYHMSIPGDRDGYQGDYVCMPSGTQSPQSHIPNHPSYFKQEPDSAFVSFSSNCINEKGRDASLGVPQPPIFSTPDWAGPTYQSWYRGSELFDPSKIAPSSILPINQQVLPYVPLCAGCQVNPALRLYPSSLLWLPQYGGYPSTVPRNSSVSTVLDDEADACLAGRHRAVIENSWGAEELSGIRRDSHDVLDMPIACMEDR
jgi:hypothetical protein